MIGDGRQEMGDRRRETEVGRWDTVELSIVLILFDKKYHD